MGLLCDRRLRSRTCMFHDAAEAAANLGAPLDQEHWLDTAGMSEARLGNLDAALDRYYGRLGARRDRSKIVLKLLRSTKRSLLFCCGRRTRKQRRSTSARPDILPDGRQVSSIFNSAISLKHNCSHNAAISQTPKRSCAMWNNSPRNFQPSASMLSTRSLRSATKLDSIEMPKAGFNVRSQPTTHNVPTCAQTIRAFPSPRTAVISTWTTSPI